MTREQAESVVINDKLLKLEQAVGKLHKRADEILQMNLGAALVAWSRVPTKDKEVIGKIMFPQYHWTIREGRVYGVRYFE